MKQKSTPEPVTKLDLKERIDALETRIDIKMEQQQVKTEDKIRKYRDEVLTKMDALALQLKTMIDEQVIVNERNQRTLERIENHESRITKLEKAQQHN